MVWERPWTGVLGLRGQKVRKGGQEGGCQAHWDIAGRAAVPELLLWGQTA